MMDTQYPHRITLPSSCLDTFRDYRNEGNFTGVVVIEEIGGPYFVAECELEVDAIHVMLRFL